MDIQGDHVLDECVTEDSHEVVLLGTVLERLDVMAEQLARIDALLTEFEPVIRAVMDPAASGPLAWAVRRKTK